MGHLAHLDKMDKGRKNVKITRPDPKPNENYLFNKKQKIDQLGRLYYRQTIEKLCFWDFEDEF